MQTMPVSCEKIKQPVTTCNPLHKYFVMIMFARSDNQVWFHNEKKPGLIIYCCYVQQSFTLFYYAPESTC